MLCRCGCNLECNKTWIRGHNRNRKGVIHSKETKHKMSIKHKSIGTGKWMLGRKLSEETKLKMSEKNSISRKGMTFSEQHKKNLSQSHIGRKYALTQEVRNKRAENLRKIAYIDGRTSLIHLIRSLPEALEWRKQVFKQNNYTCQICGSTKNRLNAHHIDKFKLIFEEFLQQYNQFSPFDDKEILLRLAVTYMPFWEAKGVTLCSICHTKYEKYNIGEIKYGNL